MAFAGRWRIWPQAGLIQAIGNAFLKQEHRLDVYALPSLMNPDTHLVLRER
jgi:hypothetical protein